MNSNQNQNEKADAILEQEIKEINKLNNYNIPPQNDANNFPLAQNNAKYNEEEIIISPEENDNNNMYNYGQEQDQGDYEEEENNEMNYEEQEELIDNKNKNKKKTRMKSIKVKKNN